MKDTDEKLKEKNQETRELFRTAGSTDQLSEAFLHDDKDDKEEGKPENNKEGSKESED